jgi:hypothetical protein
VVEGVRIAVRESVTSALLDPPRCPNCKSMVDLTELYRVALKTGETMIGHVGIVCPVCGMKLRVLQARAVLIGLLTFFLPFVLVVATYIAAPVARGPRDYIIRMAAFFVIMWSATVLHRRYIPRLLTLRLVENEEVVRFPLAPVAKKGENTEPRSALELAPVEEDRPAWTCANCGEENPGNFDECWKCQTWRDRRRWMR